jgi:hypothetical protein
LGVETLNLEALVLDRWEEVVLNAWASNFPIEGSAREERTQPFVSSLTGIRRTCTAEHPNRVGQTHFGTASEQAQTHPRFHRSSHGFDNNTVRHPSSIGFSELQVALAVGTPLYQNQRQDLPHCTEIWQEDHVEGLRSAFFWRDVDPASIPVSGEYQLQVHLTRDTT